MDSAKKVKKIPALVFLDESELDIPPGSGKKHGNVCSHNNRRQSAAIDNGVCRKCNWGTLENMYSWDPPIVADDNVEQKIPKTLVIHRTQTDAKSGRQISKPLLCFIPPLNGEDEN